MDRKILKLYYEDFYKIDQSGKAALLFNAIPAQLEKNAFRYQVSTVLENKRAESVANLISGILASKAVVAAYNSNDPMAGLSRTKDLDKFKLYVCDTGLFVTMMFYDRKNIDNVIYEKLLGDRLGVNLGYLYENAVAQLLAAKDEGLFYHTFPNESSRHNYEIDFLIVHNDKICPMEVKSSGYSTHASLDAFRAKFHRRIGDSYLVYTKDLKTDGDVVCLPVYMVPYIGIEK